MMVVLLMTVQCFGTEGRGPEWKPDDNGRVYEFVVFNAGDIKDLHVHQGPGKKVSQ